MKKSKFSFFLLMLPLLNGIDQAAASITPGSLLPLSPTSGEGYAKIQFEDTATNGVFSVRRGAPGNIATCPSGETRSYDSVNNLTWCARGVLPSTTSATYTLAKDASTNIWTFTDKRVRLDDVDTREIKYEIRNGVAGNYESGWTASCSITDGQNPLDNWIATFNHQMDATLLATTDIPSATGLNIASLASKSVTFHGGVAGTLYIYSNDKYVAVFTSRGNLVGLTHRALGEDFITHGTGDSGNQFRDPLGTSDAWAWLLKGGTSTQYNADDSCPQQSTTGVQTFSGLNGTVGTPVLDSAGNLTFTWQSISNFTGSVSTKWSLASTDSATGSASGLRGRLIVNGAPNSGGLLCATFPRLPGVGLQPIATTAVTDLIWPSSIGSKGANNSGSVLKNYSQAANGAGASLHRGLQLQFAGASRGSQGLYIASEDAASLPKYFHFSNYYVNSSSNTYAGDSYIDHFPMDGTGVAGNTLQPNYDMVLRPMCGGAERMAKQYRSWATNQSWAKSGGNARLTVNRTDISQSVRNGLFWWISNLGTNPSILLDYLQRDTLALKKEIGPTASGGNVPIGVHLYQWYQGIFDHQNPVFNDMNAAPDGTTTTSAIASLHNDNIVVMPYINISSVDISDRSSITVSGCSPSTTYGFWTHLLTYGPVAGEDMKDYLMHRPIPASPNNEDLYVFCNSRSPSSQLASADPSLSKWQQINQFNIDKVLDLGADGVYLDTYGNGYVPNFNTAHTLPTTGGHSKGHGTWWLNGLAATGADAVLRAQNGAPDPRGVIGVEYFNEALMPYGDIVMSYEPPRLSDSPLLWYAYSGYQMYAGGNSNNTTSEIAKRAIFGQSFVWGYQLGLSNGNTLCGSSTGQCPIDDKIVDYVRSLAVARNTAFLRQYLSYGELLQRVDDTTSTAALVSYTGSDAWCSGDSRCSGSAPAVRGARWKNAAGTGEIILLTNTTTATVAAAIKKPTTWDNAYVCSADGTNCSSITPSGGLYSLNFGDREIKVLQKY
jgi:uncharacterized protein DUF6259